MACDESLSRFVTDRPSPERRGGDCETHERHSDELAGDSDVETLPPDRALALLSNETRIAILRALASADEERVPFSTLQKRVGIDDSGQFNYHLNQLVGHYIQRTTDGYVLCQAGTDALEAISRL